MVNKMNFKKFLSMLICFVLSLISTSINVKAFDIGGVATIAEIEVSEELCVNVSNKYSERTYLKQATANPLGEYALLFLNFNHDGDIAPFRHSYIQVFNSEKAFLYEISLTTSESIAIELTNKTLNIYFCKMILVFQLDERTFSAYSTNEWAALESGKISDLRKTTFTSGIWTYTYQDGQISFTSLSRTNGEIKQILFETGVENDVLKSDLLSTILKSGIICLLIVVYIKRKRSRNQTEQKML